MWAATQGDHTLVVEHDDDPMNPRTDYDNFGKMACWHNRYRLGDEHSYDDPEDFLREQVVKTYLGQERKLVTAIKQGKNKNMRIHYNRSTHEWALEAREWWKPDGEWYQVRSDRCVFSANALPGDYLDDMVESLSISDMKALLADVKGFLLLPLFLYDHSGITMSTGSFSCPWDSGQVGWIYATPEMVQKKYGDLSGDSIEKARSLLQVEVETYDLFLRGQCYGFRCYEGEEETDSCWGFLSEYDDMLKELFEHLPETHQPLVAALSFQHTDSIAQYFWDIQHKAS